MSRVERARWFTPRGCKVVIANDPLTPGTDPLTRAPRPPSRGRERSREALVEDEAVRAVGPPASAEGTTGVRTAGMEGGRPLPRDRDGHGARALARARWLANVRPRRLRGDLRLGPLPRHRHRVRHRPPPRRRRRGGADRARPTGRPAPRLEDPPARLPRPWRRPRPRAARPGRAGGPGDEVVHRGRLGRPRRPRE